MTEGRYRSITIAGEMLGNILRGDWVKEGYEMIPEIPRDSVLINARHEFPNQLQIIIEHPSFDITPVGQLIPPLDIIFKQKAIN